MSVFPERDASRAATTLWALQEAFRLAYPDPEAFWPKLGSHNLATELVAELWNVAPQQLATQRERVYARDLLEAQFGALTTRLKRLTLEDVPRWWRGADPDGLSPEEAAERALHYALGVEAWRLLAADQKHLIAPAQALNELVRPARLSDLVKLDLAALAWLDRRPTLKIRA